MLLNSPSYRYFEKLPNPKFEQHQRIALLQKLGEKNRKKFFFLGHFWAFLKRETKDRRLEKHGRGRHQKSFTNILGKRFFCLPRQHYGDLPPQTHSNDCQSSVHALSNLQS